MDIIGKVYIDYILKDFNLDGKSYSINNYSFGGCCNLLDKQFLNKEFTQCGHLNYFLICNQEVHSILRKKFKNIEINFLIVDKQIPLALIFENNSERTSFVVEDNLLNIEKFSNISDSACIFYGDKVYSDIFKSYKKLFIDTAGNNKSDLNKLLKSDFIKKNSVISISSEYIENDQVENFIDSKEATLILHNPKETIIVSNKEKLSIPNIFYIGNLQNSENKNITGLGDKYFLLLSYYNNCLKLDLRKSVMKSQETIAKYLVDSLPQD